MARFFAPLRLLRRVECPSRKSEGVPDAIHLYRETPRTTAGFTKPTSTTLAINLEMAWSVFEPDVIFADDFD